MSEKTLRDLGSIYTPPDLAKFLVSWAIRDSNHKVLDVGIGEGSFIFAAYHQLQKLGAKTIEAQQQLYGAEIDSTTYNEFLRQANNLNINFPHLRYGDFFSMDFPPVDVVVGNPPYVRRTYIEDVDKIRQRVIEKNQVIEAGDLTRLTDLYIYFLLYALAILKPGGRIAVITADSWLNVGYGQGFKKYLQQHFEIDSLISFDRQVFNDAQVKPVLTLATKKERINQNWQTNFIRLKNGLPIETFQKSIEKLGSQLPDVTHFKISNRELKVDTPWSIHFKAPESYEELSSHPFMTPVVNLAETRIGIQTLAKDFFVLTSEQAETAQIENLYLEPLAQSSRYFNQPTIEPETQPNFYVFHCSKKKEDLRGTHALEYILRGEATEVEVRGKNTRVIGYHNKERIKRSSRKIWYDLKSSLERRGRAQILIPRLVYSTFTVVWNKASFVPGELFIEFLPLPLSRTDLEVYLAVLMSSVTEIMLRSHAQVYGGGTYNINPGQIKKVPILNINLLANEDKEGLKRAYLHYLEDENHDRSVIDGEVYRILGFDDRKQQKLKEVLEDLLQIATSSKKASLANP